MIQKHISSLFFPKEQQNKSLFYVCAILETIGTIHFCFGRPAPDTTEQSRAERERKER
jgi:hypothetical protein